MRKNKKVSKITIIKNGPYLIFDNLQLVKEIIVPDSEGDPIKWDKAGEYPNQESYALCRCGQSKNKPYCDGTHVKIGFDGTETASKKKYLEQAKKILGPDLILTDARALCSISRFCHRAGGVWKLTRESNKPELKKTAIEETFNCPSGRLVAWDKKTEKPIELESESSISLVGDPQKKVSGPIWVKGKVTLESSDGTIYEKRNYMTLCRCGKSRNKPFCDGTHISVKFKDNEKLSKND
jgi:CDGSH-type Zn-finger protein